jgi:hypothetical protein
VPARVPDGYPPAHVCDPRHGLSLYFGRQPLT